MVSVGSFPVNISSDTVILPENDSITTDIYCDYPDWALKEGEQLGKRKKRRKEDMQEQDGDIRLEEPNKASVVLLYMKGVTEMLKRAFNNTKSSCSAKPGTPCEMQL